jgi:hypothetical protein
MSKPQSFIIENENVYLAQEIYNYDPVFFTGISGRIRLIIEKKKLKDDDYCWGYIKGDKWIKSTMTYPKAKLLLKEEWVVNNVPKMMDQVKQELYKYEVAPSILELENEEKFKDKNGKVIEIEVRGERQHNKCYFKVKDVSNGFEMPNLQTTIQHKDNNYLIDIHYKTFTVKKLDKEHDTLSKKCLYLTYNGILKVLFSSRSGNAESFQNWAAEKLFTIQMGATEQKYKLSAELLGVYPQTIKDVFKTNSSKTPCVYLYLIGNANKLIGNKYTDNDLLCKFGCTDDLPRRTNEHDKLFSKEFNTKIELICFSIIEAKYIFQAENNIYQYFKANVIEYKNMKELIVINKKALHSIKEHYSMIQNSYIGRYEEMNNKISVLEKTIIDLNNKILLKDKDIELINEKHKNELQNKELQLKNKDIELLEYKIKLLELSNKSL